jgi:hypothetical protein
MRSNSLIYNSDRVVWRPALGAAADVQARQYAAFAAMIGDVAEGEWEPRNLALIDTAAPTKVE